MTHIQGQYFKEIDYTNYLLSKSYDQGEGYICCLVQCCSTQKLLFWQQSLTVKVKLKSYVGYLTQFLILTKVIDAPLPPS